ncbi:MAG TPA: response regulator [Bryobacteraceae bacterium]|nr:response regulator [Bryobacteraceae bacterium]
MHTATLSGARILVADDDAGARAWLRTALERAGCDVVEAKNGKEAMRFVNGVYLDICLIDLAMPEQEGMETIRMLRRACPAVKIVAFSGAFGPEFLEMSRMLGAAAALQKPIGLEKLLETVQAVLAA